MASFVSDIIEEGVGMQRQESKDRILWEIAPESNKKTDGGRRCVFNLQEKMAPFVSNIVEGGVEMQRQ